MEHKFRPTADFHVAKELRPYVKKTRQHTKPRRKIIMTAEHDAEIIARRQNGESQEKISQAMDIARSSVRKRLKILAEKEKKERSE